VNRTAGSGPLLPTSLSSDLLTLYLNDHLAGSVFGSQLARRAQAANRGTEFETFLVELTSAIDEDRRELESIIERLGVPTDRIKVAAGWLGEKIGRLKPNGQLRGYSPLSRVLELEGLSGGIHAKLSLWRALRAIAPGDERFDADHLDRLIGRAESQLEGLASMQARAAVLALSPGPAAA
jgi:hypothetical protein